MLRHTHILALGTSILLALPLSAGADEIRTKPKAVVELFTSQSCSQCPPADARLAQLGERDDIIALAYHVDYWDYAGWDDTFGQRAFSDLQRAYSKRLGASNIFTPQMVINGNQAVIGSRAEDVDMAIATADMSLTIDLVREGDELVLTIPPAPDFSDAKIYAVQIRPDIKVQIDAGENAGQTIAYTHIVTDRETLGVWDSDTGSKLRLPLADFKTTTDDIAILVQQERQHLPGTIYAAALFEK